jgi:hypothetical protein
LSEIVRQGNMLEMLNLFNINDLVVEFKQYDQKKKMDLDKGI